MYMLKREVPITHCNQCGGAGYDSGVTGRRCPRTIAGERCNGTNESALGRGDWEDCPNCAATGYYRNKECPQCLGVGYLFARPTQKQAVI
jgi:DnaJ-class molecular chaperone